MTSKSKVKFFGMAKFYNIRVPDELQFASNQPYTTDRRYLHIYPNKILVQYKEVVCMNTILGASRSGQGQV